MLFLTKKNSENILLLRKGSLRTDFRRKSRLTKWNHRGNLSQECYFCLKRGFWHGHWKSKKLWRMSTQIFSSVLLVFYVILFLWEKENTGEKGKNGLKSERVMALKSLRKFLLIWWFTVRSLIRLLSSEYFVCEGRKTIVEMESFISPRGGTPGNSWWGCAA